MSLVKRKSVDRIRHNLSLRKDYNHNTICVAITTKALVGLADSTTVVRIK